MNVLVLNRNRQPNERLAISKLKHNCDMNKSENSLAENPSTVKRAWNFVDRTGQKYGRLKVISMVRKIGDATIWNCRCDCGKFTLVRGGQLATKKTRSCGCLKGQPPTHGMSKTKVYRVWCSMKDRCYRKKCKSFQDYGGRGIRMSEDWKKSFEKFISDMGERPEGYYAVERKDNDGNYERSNCVWATREVQNNNSRHNHLIEFNGKTTTLTKWAISRGMKPITLLMRLKMGWSTEKSLTHPVRKGRT